MLKKIAKEAGPVARDRTQAVLRKALSEHHFEAAYSNSVRSGIV
jgi:hypothetical protein